MLLQNTNAAKEAAEEHKKYMNFAKTRMKSYVYEMTIVTKWKREYGSWQKWVKKETSLLAATGEIITVFPNDFAFCVRTGYKRKESTINATMYLRKYTV